MEGSYAYVALTTMSEIALGFTYPKGGQKCG